MTPDLRKPSRTARKKQEQKDRRDERQAELTNKRSARVRDRFRCRFPLCGCHRLGLQLDARAEVSHDRHKGMGGNPAGDRSLTPGLITLCLHRHQDGIFSRHKGTMRSRPLTRAGNDGPVAWDLLLSDAFKHFGDLGKAPLVDLYWFEVAREKRVCELEPLTELQGRILRQLEEMDL